MWQKTGYFDTDLVHKNYIPYSMFPKIKNNKKGMVWQTHTHTDQKRESITESPV